MIPTGLALDIDDTLADTAVECFKRVGKRFGFPQGKSAMQLCKVYHQPGNVPVWQTSEIQNFIRGTFFDQEWLLSLPPIVETVRVTNRIAQTLPISVYLTSRTHDLAKVTKQWLRVSGFPLAPVITRSVNITAPDWKLTVLTNQFPDTYGFVDNELGFLPLAKHAYQGRLFWFDRYQSLTKHTQLVKISDWQHLEQILLQSE